MVSGTTFTTPVLNLAEGSHHLRVRSTNGAGQTSDAVYVALIDETAPSSEVNPLPATETSYAITVSASGSDPGTGASGIASYALYVAIDNGAFSAVPWATVPATNPTAVYPAQSGHHYYFRSVATDIAGNVESKAVTYEAGTFVPDLTPPATRAVSATPNAATAQFTISLTGTDAGGSGLQTFEVFAQLDNGLVTQFATLPAGSPNGSGVYNATVTYQAAADGLSHTYRFYSKGIDGAGNTEADHVFPNDVDVTQTFTTQPVQATQLIVQDGAAQRSFISTIDLEFNTGDTTGNTPLASLISQGRITLIQHQLDGVSRTSDPSIPLTGMLSVVDHAIEINFGQLGLGGVSQAGLSLAKYWSEMIQGDGYYELDVNPVSGPEQVFHFYRLLGDIDGRGVVDNTDVNEITSALGQTGLAAPDVNGNGLVDVTDKALA